jgi:hypothetical protein
MAASSRLFIGAAIDRIYVCESPARADEFSAHEVGQDSLAGRR